MFRSRLVASLLVALAHFGMAPRVFPQAGTLDTTFGDANISGGIAPLMAVDGSGKILIAGTFTSVGGATHNRIARLNADGTVDPTFTPNVTGAGPGGTVSVINLATQADGKILIAGSFSTVNGSARNNIARLNSDGTLDATYNPNASGIVYGLSVQPDGKAVVCGGFYEMGGATVVGFTRLQVNGAVDPTYSGGNILAQEQGLVAQGDGKLLLLPSSHGKLARRFLNGAQDTAFNASGACVGLNAVAMQMDGRIFSFVQDTLSTGHLKRFNADGTSDGTFAGGAVTNTGDAVVNSIYVQADRKVVMAGAFNKIDSATRVRLARRKSRVQ